MLIPPADIADAGHFVVAACFNLGGGGFLGGGVYAVAGGVYLFAVCHHAAEDHVWQTTV